MTVTMNALKSEVSKIMNMNPYLEDSIKYFVDNAPRFIYSGKTYSKEELDAMYMETALEDAKKGYAERVAGYYDKWYRCNRADNGRAYDIGVAIAISTATCDELTIIECVA